MSSESFDISIIVAGVPSDALLRKSLCTVGRQSFFRDKLRTEVLVIDGSRSPEQRLAVRGVVEAFAREVAAAATVRCVPVVGNAAQPDGSSYLRNVGLRLSRAGVILLAHPHVLHVSETIHQHYIRQSDADNAMVLGFCRECAQNLTPEQDSMARALHDDRLGVRVRSGSNACGPFCASVPRKWLMAIGGWDEDLGGGYQDYDLVRRLSGMGVRLLRDDSIKTLHQAQGEQEPATAGMLELYRAKSRVGSLAANQGRRWGELDVPPSTVSGLDLDADGTQT